MDVVFILKMIIDDFCVEINSCSQVNDFIATKYLQICISATWVQHKLF